MLALTGAGGFIGRNLAPLLAARGGDLLAVELPERLDAAAAATAQRADCIAAGAFLARLGAGHFDHLEAIVHLGARTDTTDPDDAGVLDGNYRYAAALMDAALARGIRFLYASSAAVYGNAPADLPAAAREAPLNVYGFSKWLLDRHARRRLADPPAQLAGVRPFNVYGPFEAAKGRMASMVHQLADQLDSDGRVRLFGAGEGCAAGEQRRDFIHVDDLCAVLLWLLERPGVSGLFDAGSGRSRSFNELARRLLDARGGGHVDYLPFPDALRGRYQIATLADLAPLRAAGFDRPLLSLEQGLRRYLAWRDAPTGVAAVA